MCAYRDRDLSVVLVQACVRMTERVFTYVLRLDWLCLFMAYTGRTHGFILIRTHSRFLSRCTVPRDCTPLSPSLWSLASPALLPSRARRARHSCRPAASGRGRVESRAQRCSFLPAPGRSPVLSPGIPTASAPRTPCSRRRRTRGSAAASAAPSSLSFSFFNLRPFGSC